MLKIALQYATAYNICFKDDWGKYLKVTYKNNYRDYYG